VAEKQKTRRVVLPGNTSWYDTASGKWIKGGQTVSVKASAADTPLYVRDGSILPLARLDPADHAFDAAKADFHIFLAGDGEAATRYVFDDGDSFAYREGKRSEAEITVKQLNRSVSVAIVRLSKGYGNGDFTFTTDASVKEVFVNGKPARPGPAQGVAFTRVPLVTWMPE